MKFSYKNSKVDIIYINNYYWIWIDNEMLQERQTKLNEAVKYAKNWIDG